VTNDHSEASEQASAWQGKLDLCIAKEEVFLSTNACAVLAGKTLPAIRKMSAAMQEWKQYPPSSHEEFQAFRKDVQTAFLQRERNQKNQCDRNKRRKNQQSFFGGKSVCVVPRL
jgi:hypothetical protein